MPIMFSENLFIPEVLFVAGSNYNTIPEESWVIKGYSKQNKKNK